jgi:hypothetical protein
MFGSLLASYVLGFIGFVAAYSRPDLALSAGEVLGIWDQVLVRAPFLFISITYAYITAGFYVFYHSGIMTMHQMPLGHISFDFALSLSQALLFGISMIYPMYFPALLAFTLLLAVSRQHQEHRQLVESVWGELYPALEKKDPRRKPPHPKELKPFRKEFSNLLKNKKFPLLLVWAHSSLVVVVSTFVLIILNAVAKGLVVLKGTDPKYVLGAVPFIIMCGVVLYVHITLGQRASLLNEMDEMDGQFAQLLGELESKENVHRNP